MKSRVKVVCKSTKCYNYIQRSKRSRLFQLIFSPSISERAQARALIDPLTIQFAFKIFWDNISLERGEKTHVESHISENAERERPLMTLLPETARRYFRPAAHARTRAIYPSARWCDSLLFHWPRKGQLYIYIYTLLSRQVINQGSANAKCIYAREKWSLVRTWCIDSPRE